MTKKEIVRLVSEKTDLSQQQTKEIVQKTFESIIEVLVKDGRIELRNFGVFEVKVRAARNPRTGVEVWVDEHETVAFKPGKMMVAKVQRERQKKAKKAAAKKVAKAAKPAKAAAKKTSKKSR